MPETPNLNLESRESENQSTARLLTDQERELLEHEGLQILEDKPNLLYCFGGNPPLYFIKNTEGLENVNEMIKKDKSIIFVQEDTTEDEEVKLPTLNEAIDLIVKRKGLIQDALEKFGHIKTNRSIMNERDISREKKELASKLSHNNGYGFCDAFPPKKDLGYTKIKTFAPPNLSDPFMLRFGLEVCSATWLEPRVRSGSSYSESGLNRNDLSILDNPEVLRKAIESEGENSILFGLQKTINDDFGGDAIVFQKRWKEYYENWWPDEFKAMQDAVDKTKEWLKTQKDPK